MMHDPYVKADDQNLIKSDLQNHFSQDIISVLGGASFIVFCTAHRTYREDRKAIIKAVPHLQGVFDGCNLFQPSDFAGKLFPYRGIGKGKLIAPQDFLDFVTSGFKAVERGFANEIKKAIDFFNDHFSPDDFNRVDFNEVRRLAATCVTGCEMVEPGPVREVLQYRDFMSRLAGAADNGSL
jgi:hypothetical protein